MLDDRKSNLLTSPSFGNKSSSTDSYGDDSTRFGTGSNTDSYSGSNEYGSGATGGAG